MAKNYKSIETALIHAGEERRFEGAVALPIFQSAMFEYEGTEGYYDLKYIRLHNTPNHAAIHKKLASLENAESALVLGSGMAAISTAILSVVSAGDHILVQDTLYGGTHDLFTKNMEGFGIEYDFIDADDPDSWRAKLRPNTKALYCESLTNPLLQVGDLESLAKFANAHGLTALVDNTFTGPINFRPLDLGFHLSLHSCTKSLNGHSDIVGGAIIGNAERITKCLHLACHLGGSLDPHACFLLLRGMKTLALRMNFQNKSTLKIAEFLSTHSVVKRVNYPGLKNHANHDRAASLFKGCGGVFSFELKGGLSAATRFMERVQIPIIAPSLGGVETLATLPSKTSHAGLSKAEREKAGISEGLIRISVGIENTDELIADFTQALQ